MYTDAKKTRPRQALGFACLHHVMLSLTLKLRRCNYSTQEGFAQMIDGGIQILAAGKTVIMFFNVRLVSNQNTSRILLSRSTFLKYSHCICNDGHRIYGAKEAPGRKAQENHQSV